LLCGKKGFASSFFPTLFISVFIFSQFSERNIKSTPKTRDVTLYFGVDLISTY